MSSARQGFLAVIRRFFESKFRKKSIVLRYDNQNSRNTGVSGVFSCPKAGFSLVFSLMGSTGGNCADKTLHAVGAFALHLLRHMAIHVQCEGGSGVAQITLHGLDVISRRGSRQLRRSDAGRGNGHWDNPWPRRCACTRGRLSASSGVYRTRW